MQTAKDWAVILSCVGAMWLTGSVIETALVYYMVHFIIILAD